MTGSFYQAVWRWHFYAGLFVLPLLVWLAVTGALYLYKPEIERTLYRDWIALDGARQPMPAAEMIERVEAVTSGRVTQLTRPAARDESWRMNVQMLEGGDRTIFVDPADGRLLGQMAGGGAMETIRALHGLAITGPIGNALIEIAAGWAIILVLSGFYLWWPRSGQRALALRGRPRERRFWRDLHASGGALVGAVILFLAVTGMPWSIFWGAQLQQLITANELGRPSAPAPQPWEKAGPSHHADAQRNALPWAMQAAAPPHAHGSGDIGIDRVIAIADQHGLAEPYVVNLPQGAGAPYTLSRLAERADQTRLIYVEPATGHVLQDIAYGDFGAGAQVVEWGIFTHQGQTYGELNRLLMLFGCLGVLLLAITGPVLWWKRRRNGRLEPPPTPQNARALRNVAALMVVLGVVYPLTGATMLIALAGDILLRRRRSVAPA
jgi:uncharacterized iron-regulated membrane protein